MSGAIGIQLLMKIGISGSVCTGKTTLATAIAERLGVALVPETARVLLEQLQLGPGGERESLSDKIQFQKRLIEYKERSESQHSAFVADRTFVDAAAYWLYYVSKEASDMQSGRYLEQCEQRMVGYDLVLLLRFDRLGGDIVDDGFRTSRLAYRMALHLLIQGLLLQWRVPHTIVSSRNNDQIVDEVANLM